MIPTVVDVDDFGGNTIVEGHLFVKDTLKNLDIGNVRNFKDFFLGNFFNMKSGF